MNEGGIAGDPALCMRDVCFAYAERPVIRGLSLSAARGSALGLIGPNGCGKSTTLHLACGLLTVAGGSVTVMGQTVPGRPEVINSLLAYVPDVPAGFEHLSVSEYCRLLGALHRADADYARRVDDLMEILALSPYARAAVGGLSHGTRRKVALIAAAALDRPLLLVDEATSALDPESVIALEQLIRAVVTRGRTVVLATQDVYFAERVCDTVCLLADGAVVASGTVASLLEAYERETLRDVFMAVTGLAVSEDRVHAALARPDDR